MGNLLQDCIDRQKLCHPHYSVLSIFLWNTRDMESTAAV